MTLLFSPLILGDPNTSKIIAGALISVLGNTLIIFQPGSNFSAKAFPFGFGCVVAFSLNNCLDRLAAQGASPVISAFAMNLAAGALLGIFMLYRRESFQPLDYYSRLQALRGLLETMFMTMRMAVFAMLSGPQYAALGRISLAFNVIAARVYFQERGVVRKLTGALLPLLGALIGIYDRL